MFTGLIEEIGRIAVARHEPAGTTITVAARTVLEDIKLGDSIAVNGTCLTVTVFDAAGFTVGLAPETCARTNLAELAPGALVNVERSLTPSSRLGGHFVQGHVDATGTVKTLRPDQDSLWVVIEAPRDLMRYVVAKGFIAVDGASLTVVETGDSWFSIVIIAHSQERITLSRKRPGEPVNLEVDILAKYTERLLARDKPSRLNKARP